MHFNYIMLRNPNVMQTELGETVAVTRETGIACSQNWLELNSSSGTIEEWNEY